MRSLFSVSLVLCSFVAHGCSLDLKHEKKDQDPQVVPQYPQSSPQYPADSSNSVEKSSGELFGDHEAPVFVHYMASEDLGDEVAAFVEVFDNRFAQGAPTQVVPISGFRAHRGSWTQTPVKLAAGTHWLRAYLTTADDRRLPYEIGDMLPSESVESTVYGSVSRVEELVIDKNQAVTPTNLFFNSLLVRPGTEPETNARIRINLTVADGVVINADRKVRVELRETDDLQVEPVARLGFSSNLLLIEGRHGQTEYVTPNLPEGKYTVFAFIDEDGNDRYDAGEAAQLYVKNGAALLIKVEKNRLTPIDLQLVARPELPGL